MMDSAPITKDEVVDGANEQKTGETGTETAMDVDVQKITVQREIDDEIKILPSNEETWMNLRFDTKDHGLLWYKGYAHDKGFSVRETGGVKRTSNNKPCGVVRYFGGRCNKEGWRKGSANNPANDDHVDQQPRSRITKEDRWDCKAVIRFQLEDSSQKYYISSWLDEHNHKMIPPSSRQFMRSNRTMNEVQKFLIDMYHKAGISIQSSFQALCLAAGGRENVGFTQMDHKNYIRTKRQKIMKFGEATMIYHHFKSEASMDPAFFYEIQVDINEEIANQQRNPIDKRIVMVDFVERKLICSCKMFEKCGWLCRHVLRAIDHLGYGGHPEILNIHTRYILKRWTYDAKSGDFTLPAVQDTTERVYCSRVKQLTGSMNLFSTRTCMDDDIYKMLEEGMQALKIRAESMMPAMKFGQPSTSTEAELNPASSESEPHWAKALKVRTDPFKSRTRRKNRIEIIRERRRQTKLQERATEGK
ncbi:unnamed protein product [Linum trigynum]|uniref:SWIM-type domain-containing protein n=1 Tax=Linum trigynum TaxID=586398 RepID=A0AAV2GLQ8_9ROSI